MANSSDDTSSTRALPESVLRSLCLGGLGTWRLYVAGGLPVLELAPCFPTLLGYPPTRRKAPLRDFLDEWVHADDRRLISRAFGHLAEEETPGEAHDALLPPRISGTRPDIAPPVFRVRAADGRWKFVRIIGSPDVPADAYAPPVYQGIIQLVEESHLLEERAIFSSPREVASPNDLARTGWPTAHSASEDNGGHLTVEQCVRGMPSTLFAVSMDGALLEWSEGAEQSMPLDNAVKGSTSFVSLILEEDRPHAALAMANALSASSQDMRLRAVRRDGHVGMFSLQCRAMEAGNATILIVLLFDLTEGIAINEAMKAERSWLDSVMRAGRLGVWEWNVATNEVIWNEDWRNLVNPEMKTLHGTVEDWKNAILPEDLPVASEALASHMRGEVPYYEAQYRMRRWDGEIFWASDRGGIVERAKDGSPIRIMGIIQDISGRKKAEEELVKSKNQLELAVHASGLATWEWNLADDSLQFSNYYADLLGYELDDLPRKGMVQAELIQPDDRLRIRTAIAEHMAGRSDFFDCEVRARHKTGVWVWLRAVGRGIEGSPEKGGYSVLAGGIYDITTQKEHDKLQKDAIAAIARHKAALQREVVERTKLLREVRKRVQDILATSPDASVINPSALLPGLADAVPSFLSQAGREGSTASGLEQSQNVSGTDNFAKGLNKAFNIITDKMWWYKAIIDSIPFPLFATDEDERWTYMNRPGLDYMGTESLAGLFGKPAVLPGEVVDGNKADIEEGSGRRHFTLYHEGLGKWFENQWAYLFDQHGHITGHIGAMQDVSETKIKERELRLARDAAQESARAKSDFLANMSHEIRTPMNAVLGMTHMVLKSELQPAQRTNLERAEHAARSLLRLLNDILDFSKIEAGKLDMENAPFNLDRLFEDTVAIYEEAALQKGLSFSAAIDENVPRNLSGDALRLGQVLTNLLSNAVKFTNQGSVLVRVSNEGYNGGRAVIRFSVSDTGIGLPTEGRDKLFLAFSQQDPSTTRRYGGTGLGLAISKLLVSMMGGELTARSAPGEGATFSFTALFFPADEAPEHRAAEDLAELEKSLEALKGLKILVAEDNEINRIVAGEMLDEKGFLVDMAVNGVEAVAMASQRAYDIIFMDIQMPDMDGFAATAALRQRGLTSTPIIAMTAHAMVGDREKSLQHGMNDHLTKPLEDREVFSSIVRWAHFKQSPAQPGESAGTAKSAGNIVEAAMSSAVPPSQQEITVYPDGVDSADGIRRVAGNKKLFDKLLRRIAAELPQNLADMRAAVESGDAEKVSVLAHTLKGSSANLSIVFVQEKSLALESAAKAGDKPAMEIALEELEVVAHAYIAALAVE